MTVYLLKYLITKYLIFLQVTRVFQIFVNGSSMTNAKVYQGLRDYKNDEEYWDSSMIWWGFALSSYRKRIPRCKSALLSHHVNEWHIHVAPSSGFNCFDCSQ